MRNHRNRKISLLLGTLILLALLASQSMAHLRQAPIPAENDIASDPLLPNASHF